MPTSHEVHYSVFSSFLLLPPCYAQYFVHTQLTFAALPNNYLGNYWFFCWYLRHSWMKAKSFIDFQQESLFCIAKENFCCLFNHFTMTYQWLSVYDIKWDTISVMSFGRGEVWLESVCGGLSDETSIMLPGPHPGLEPRTSRMCIRPLKVLSAHQFFYAEGSCPSVHPHVPLYVVETTPGCLTNLIWHRIGPT